MDPNILVPSPSLDQHSCSLSHVNLLQWLFAMLVAWWQLAKLPAGPYIGVTTMYRSDDDNRATPSVLVRVLHPGEEFYWFIPSNDYRSLPPRQVCKTDSNLVLTLGLAQNFHRKTWKKIRENGRGSLFR